MSTHNIILDIINDSSSSKIDQLNQLQNVITQLSKTELLELNVSSINIESFKLIVNLLKIESIMTNYPKEPLIKTLMEQDSAINATGITFLSPSTTTTDEEQYINTFIKAKLNDLQSDYQYLFKELQYDNFIDLINKKMLILNNLNNNGINISSLKDKLNLKILQLYLISNYDFRNDNILNHLINEIHQQQQQQENKYINEIEILREVQSQPFVSYELFKTIIDHDFNNSYYQIINQLMKFDKLHRNIIENNIIKLTNYFTNIEIKTIHQLFELSPPPTSKTTSTTNNLPTIDIESMIFDMIIKNKFRNVTTIDQLNQTVSFNNDDNKNNNEDGIKYIGGLVNQAYMKI